MKIFEVEEDPAAANGKKLAAISMFLSSRAGDEAAKKEISQDAFIDMNSKVNEFLDESTLNLNR